ncbi:MAG: family 16 glycosylhydrolase [Bacteroidales bacterium]|nr:family 16 glycosylhydrolase [Bacteroidales bacterium]
MANIAFGSKYFIFSKFSSIPKTSKIEQDRATLIKEYNDLQDFKRSKELEEFNELGTYLESSEYKKKVAENEKVRSAEEAKIKKYEDQKKSKQYKKHFRFRESAKLRDHQSFAGSKELAEFNNLKKEIANPASKNNKEDQEAKQKRLNQLQKSPSIKKYLKFEKSAAYTAYTSFENSKEFNDHQALGKYLQSPEHKEALKTATSELEAENNKKKKFDEFKNSKKYKWYLGLKDADKFKEITRWQIVFEDTFSAKKLDTEKWMTRYYWGDKLINGAYALETDKAFPTDGKNIETGNTLKITTRREKATGQVWKMPFGFIPQEFEYTTGLVSTARSHRQKFGKIEAKIKVNFAKPVNYNFWMASEKNLPHVDILRLQDKKSKVDVGHVYNQGKGDSSPARNASKFTGLDVSQDFFIYTLEWSKSKLTWKINEVVVHEQSNNIPNEEMYLVFSSGITGKPSDAGLPASMEIDWVRCYQEK